MADCLVFGLKTRIPHPMTNLNKRKSLKIQRGFTDYLFVPYQNNIRNDEKSIRYTPHHNGMQIHNVDNTDSRRHYVRSHNLTHSFRRWPTQPSVIDNCVCYCGVH